MQYVEHRTIAELCTLYELEPSVREVFVEGSCDAALIKWFLRHRSPRAVSVKEIDAIDVPETVLAAHNCDIGSRGHVLALAAELDSALEGTARKCATLIYDADWDRLFENVQNLDILLSTDFACIEMYLFNEATVGKMMSLVLMGCDVSAQQALLEFAKVLVRLCVIKAANHLLGFSMSWIAFDRCCSLSGTSIQFDEAEFIKRYLMNNSHLSDEGDFVDKMGEVEIHLQEDSRHQMNGHHFLTLSRWYFRHFANERSVCVGDKAFERAFFGCLELDLLDQQPLFQQLKRRLAV